MKTFEEVKQFKIAGGDIPCEKNVKLLGVEMDFMLNLISKVKSYARRRLGN